MESFSEISLIQSELEQAERARAQGNEGMARVCARRAAGIAAGAYIKRNGYPISGTSAYDRLKYLSQTTGIPDDIRHVAKHFLVRVTPDHNLPGDTDLIQDARWLIRKLLESSQEK